MLACFTHWGLVPVSKCRLSRILEGTWLGIFSVLGAFVIARIALGVSSNPPPATHLLMAALAGYLASDFASGFVHFLADTIGSARTPWLGRHFIAPFRAHHAAPEELVEHDFIETNGNNTLIALFVLVPATWNLSAEAGGTPAVYSVFWLSLAAFVVMTNQFHKWAHAASMRNAKPLPRLVRTLQRSRLILNPTHHAEHHKSPHDRHYCTTSGMLNPLLDGIGFFSFLRRMTRPRPPARPGRETNPS